MWTLWIVFYSTVLYAMSLPDDLDADSWGYSDEKIAPPEVTTNKPQAPNYQTKEDTNGLFVCLLCCSPHHVQIHYFTFNVVPPSIATLYCDEICASIRLSNLFCVKQE